MSRFSTVTISNIGATITGKTPSSDSPEDFGSEFPFVTPSDPFGQKYIEKTERHLSKEGVRKLKGKLLPPESIMVTCIGSAMGKVAMNRLPSITNQQINSIVVSDNHSPAYAYYTLLNNYKLLRNAAGGSTALPLLNKSDFDLLTIRIHSSKEEQQKIAAVLSALDAKIDCNNRINAELEAMAKTLYDYWFVQFDFPFDFASGKPDKSGKPYKSSGGKMVYNPTLKREIPAGWKDSSILAVADLLGGGTPTKKKPEYWNGDIPFFTPTDADGTIFKFATADFITEEGLKKSSTKLFAKNTVFITARGSVGKLVLTGTDMAMNQSCYALRAKPGTSHTYLFFLAKELIHHLEVKSSGSVFNSIVSNDIEFTNLAIPDPTLVGKFAAVVEPVFERIANNTKENQHLTQLRDWLLPMLMNGQVRVV
ncbi:MAG: restriction endonuclease subunit S [Pseudomonadota bacterium]